MVKNLMHDPVFLSVKAKDADETDAETAKDLLDTLKAHREECVGMAANMIGIAKKIIAFTDGKDYFLMYNPKIIKSSSPYAAKEGCLSLLGGERDCKRYKKITVQWQNETFSTRTKTFEGFVAQIIQHEIDHLNGILI